MTESILQWLGLPPAFDVTLLTVGLTLSLAPYLTGVELGPIKIPTLPPETRVRLRILGPLAFGAAIGLHVPFLSDANAPLPISKLADPPILWVRGAESPLAGGTGGDMHATTCPSDTAVVGLRGTTGEANTPGFDSGIEWVWDLQFICAPLSIEKISPTRYEFRTGHATTWTERIGGGGGRDTGPIQCAPNEVVTAFDAESRRRGYGDAEYLNYFVARCGRVALIYAGGKWDVEIITSQNLSPIGTAQLGGRRTIFSCADGRRDGDGVVTRINAKAGSLIDAVGFGCSRPIANSAP